MQLLNSFPAWVWVLAILIEQLLFMLLLQRIKSALLKRLEKKAMELERNREIMARARQLAIKAGWDVSKSGFITEKTK
jgi:hypothetical protein